MPDQVRAEHPVRKACDILFEPGQTVEVRTIGKRGAGSGFFNDYDKLTSATVPLDNRGEYAGTYVTLNPVNPDLLARRANRIETRLGRDEKSAGDADILSRRWLPIDIDPVRPSGVSSSDTEHVAAIEKASRMAAYLADIGWPQPVMADSGNGAHLLYRIDLPNDTRSRDLVKHVLETLDLLFSDHSSTVDTSVYNAARIWKLYGTTSRKGDNIAVRPHRKSAVLSVPPVLEIVTVDHLESLAGMLPREEEVQAEPDRRPGSRIDLAVWLRDYGIGYEQKPYAGGWLFVLEECPFSSDHKSGAYAIQFGNGAIFAGCHHTSCGGGSQRWAELRERYEGPVPGRTRSSNAVNRERSKKADPAPVSDPGSPEQPPGEITTAATAILHEGDPLTYMLETFSRDHIGDPVVAECLLMSLASRQVINAKGLHVLVTGESGKGKSHAFETIMQQVPDEFRLDDRMSEKALFYIKGMHPGSVIILDDQYLSDQMQEILKGVTTSFRRPFTYRTVNKDRVGETCTIPERCVWWIAKVDGTGDDQIWNRMLTCWIDDSEEQDEEVLKQALRDATCLQQERRETRPEALVCQEIWRLTPPAWVVIPFAERIRFSSAMNRRNPDMLLDLVRAHAVLMQYQRVHVETEGMTQIIATEEDFAAAQTLYMALNSTSGGQESKLTKKESALVEVLRSHGQGEITVAELQILVGKTFSVVYKMLHGSISKGHEYAGLLDKCPALSVCDRTLMVDESGTTSAYRRSKAYSWDARVYEAWSSEGGCWLDPEDPGRDSGDDDHGDEPGSQMDQKGSDSEACDHTSCCGTADHCGQTAEISATNPGMITGLDHENNNNTSTLGTDCGKLESTEKAVQDLLAGGTRVCAPEISATSDQVPESGSTVHPDRESGPDGYCPDFRNVSAAAQNEPRFVDPSATTQGDKTRSWKVRAADFCEIDRGFGSGPCDCCGTQWVHFQEKMSYNRMSEPPRMNRKICRTCYEVAREAEAAGIRVLPGVIDPGSLVRLTSDRGRCQVCDTFKATWHDPGSKTSVCDLCRSRILREGS